jgi:hypothetical protein
MKLLKHEALYWARFNTHSPDKCKGEPCPVHNPSNHHMRKWKLNYRTDRGITERICQHGVGHPDPDDKFAKGVDAIHGCCGCCSAPSEPAKASKKTPKGRKRR